MIHDNGWKSTKDVCVLFAGFMGGVTVAAVTVKVLWDRLRVFYEERQR